MKIYYYCTYRFFYFINTVRTYYNFKPNEIMRINC